MCRRAAPPAPTRVLPASLGQRPTLRRAPAQAIEVFNANWLEWEGLRPAPSKPPAAAANGTPASKSAAAAGPAPLKAALHAMRELIRYEQVASTLRRAVRRIQREQPEARVAGRRVLAEKVALMAEDAHEADALDRAGDVDAISAHCDARRAGELEAAELAL